MQADNATSNLAIGFDRYCQLSTVNCQLSTVLQATDSEFGRLIVTTLPIGVDISYRLI
jgi:hypothetical protein